ncbi:MAG: SurA N-terminal domain-containing protein [Planctomycetes bacterium]|nr:SurA N-terminal domain-containing protein [Planctomycetota bacterium]
MQKVIFFMFVISAMFLASEICQAADRTVPIEEGILFDRPVRYVNQQLITQQDVETRVLENLQIAGRTRFPTNPNEVKKIKDQALLELTYEELVLQEAERLGLQISFKLISEDVRTRVLEAGREPELATMAELAKRQMRSTKIKIVIRHYLNMAPSIRPADINTYYQKNINQYRRPARWHLYQIVMNPSGIDQKKHIFKNMMVIYRAVLGSQQAEIKDLLDNQATTTFSVMEFGGDEQMVFLSNLCQKVIELEIENMGGRSHKLKETAQRWHTAAENLRSKEQVTQTLQTVLDALNKIDDPEKRLTYFKEQANLLSIGLGATQGGDLKYIEKDPEQIEVHQHLDGLALSTPSSIIWSKKSAYLLFVPEKEEAVQRGFSEVSGEILTLLEKRQQAAVKHDIEKQLFEAASIVDIPHFLK